MAGPLGTRSRNSQAHSINGTNAMTLISILEGKTAVCKQARKDSGLQFRHNPEESRQEAGTVKRRNRNRNWPK